MLRPAEIVITAALLLAGFALVLNTETTAAQSLAERLSGQILLQVEENGEAWYVYPDSRERYFLGRPEDAFEIMRKLGLGISNTDLALIPEQGNGGGSQSLRERLSGQILLQVEENGEAWYVYPENLQRYYMGRPADAFELMRSLGLGITNENLLGIPVASDSKTPDGISTPPPPNADPALNDGHDTQRTTLLNDINAERSSAGLVVLSLSAQLNEAAQAQADDMTSQQYFDFVSPQGKEVSDFAQDAGYQAYTLAENLVQTNQGIGNVVNVWKTEQQTSLANALEEDYRDLGVGVGSFEGIPVYVVVFGRSMKDFFTEATAGLHDINQVRNEMLELVNQERAKAGLASLVMNSFLHQAAQAHTDDMLNRSYYGHQSPEGTTAHDRIKATGYNPRSSGENIAKGQFSVQEVMEGWINSPDHLANILNDGFTEVGFGLSFGLNQNGYEVIWAQNFADPF